MRDRLTATEEGLPCRGAITSGDKRVRVSTRDGQKLGWVIDGRFVPVISQQEVDDMISRTIRKRPKPT